MHAPSSRHTAAESAGWAPLVLCPPANSPLLFFGEPLKSLGQPGLGLCAIFNKIRVQFFQLVTACLEALAAVSYLHTAQGQEWFKAVEHTFRLSCLLSTAHLSKNGLTATLQLNSTSTWPQCCLRAKNNQKLYFCYKINSSHKTLVETPKSPALKFSSVNSSPRQHTCQKPREIKYCINRSEKPLESQTSVEGSQFPEKCLL